VIEAASFMDVSGSFFFVFLSVFFKKLFIYLFLF
jgi:hypothetical protein